MRAYIDGKVTRQDGLPLKDNHCFLPAGLWFNNPEEEFDWEITDNCIRLDGLSCESSVDKETNTFTCRWKGVELCYIDHINGHTETEDFEIEKFKEIIEEKNMRLVNMDAYYDNYSLNVEITNLVLIDNDENDTSYEFNTNLIDKIEFIE